MEALISPLVGSLGALGSKGLYGDFHSVDDEEFFEPSAVAALFCCFDFVSARPPLPMMKEAVFLQV
jgi:hypothetical protein